ncbi:MAG: hypothetical protein P4M11_09370 [Candidatus Pacebacteria bacterium]|nr:hypothetical protein [Candidatus Paceibacterota bacterium]
MPQEPGSAKRCCSTCSKCCCACFFVLIVLLAGVTFTSVYLGIKLIKDNKSLTKAKTQLTEKNEKMKKSLDTVACAQQFEVKLNDYGYHDIIDVVTVPGKGYVTLLDAYPILEEKMIDEKNNSVLWTRQQPSKDSGATLLVSRDGSQILSMMMKRENDEGAVKLNVTVVEAQTGALVHSQVFAARQGYRAMELGKHEYAVIYAETSEREYYENLFAVKIDSEGKISWNVSIGEHYAYGMVQVSGSEKLEAAAVTYKTTDPTTAHYFFLGSSGVLSRVDLPNTVTLPLVEEPDSGMFLTATYSGRADEPSHEGHKVQVIEFDPRMSGAYSILAYVNVFIRRLIVSTDTYLITRVKDSLYSVTLNGFNDYSKAQCVGLVFDRNTKSVNTTYGYSPLDDSHPSQVKPTANGNLLYLGTTDITQVDLQGKVLWQQTITKYRSNGWVFPTKNDFAYLYFGKFANENNQYDEYTGARIVYPWERVDQIHKCSP